MCTFGLRRVRFLVYIVDENGINFDEEKVKAIIHLAK